MSGSILFVGLDYDFVKKVAYECSKKLDKLFLDAKSLIEYNLIDIEKLKVVCGVEYFEKEQKKVISSLSEYENVVISFPYNLILNDEYFDYVKNLKIIFIEIDKQTLNNTNKTMPKENNLNIEILAYEELTNVLRDRCTKIIVAKTEEEFIEKSIRV